MDAVAALMFAGVFTLTLLPLVVVLPTAPPMSDAPDDAPQPTSRHWPHGWRISLSIGRIDDGPKASNLP